MTTNDSARRAAYEDLMGQVYEPLQRYLRRRCAAADVDDVFVDALTALWQRLEEVPAGRELPWAYGVARRCLANHRRSGARRSRLLERVGRQHAEEVSPQWTSAADVALQEALDRLPERDREIIRLWGWERLQPREIAEVVGDTPNAVSVRLGRIQSRLARDIEHAGQIGDIARQDPAGAGHEGFVSRQGQDR